MKNFYKSFWLQALFILFGAFLMTRILTEGIEFLTYDWNSSVSGQKFIRELSENCRKLQIDTQQGCYIYPKAYKAMCATIGNDQIEVIIGNESFVIAKSKRNEFLGSRSIEIGTGETESDMLRLGAAIQKLDEEVDSREKKSIRWLQALMDTAKSYSRWNTFFNGSIQFFIYYFSMIIFALFIIDNQFLNRNRNQLEREVFLHSQEPVLSLQEVSDLVNRLDEEIKKTDYHPEIEPNILLNLLKHSFEALLSYKGKVNIGELITNVEAYGQGLQERIERRIQIIRYFLNAIPSLGFIGTVWGISEALTATSKLTGESLSYERMLANSSLGKSLSFAFDTTLVGLVATIVLSLLVDWLENREMSFVIDVRHKLLNRLTVIEAIR